MSSPAPTDGTAAAPLGLSSSDGATGSSQKTTDSMHTMASQYDQLVQLLYTKLPQVSGVPSCFPPVPPDFGVMPGKELFDKIRETTLELAICPGYVFPQQSTPGQETFDWNGRTHFVARPELPRLSNGLYAKYHDKYWGGNVFVIGKGLVSESFEWLDKLPSSSSQSIRKVHLTFSPDDLVERGEYFLGLIPRPAVQRCVAQAGTRDYGRVATLVNIWVDKMYKISTLHMTELTLEFTKCKPELAWVLMRCIGPFVHGIPSELRIINYNKQYEEKTLEFLKETHERLKGV
ncbi:MAG: hypothetical protein Q9221_008068 [Calogaya cf. arnoldii]